MIVVGVANSAAPTVVPAAPGLVGRMGEVSAASFQPTEPRPARLPGTRCRAFPADSWWHADVSALAVHPDSDAWMASSGAAGRNLHPDFGPSFGEQPVPYGIPITVVRGRWRGVRVDFGYSDESDHVRYPLRRSTKIEGGWNADGDRHAIVVSARNCRLFETWDTRRNGRRWYAGSGATWSLRSNGLRPDSWTSADAAGLPILPGLLRWDEVERGYVDHAIRFTVPRTAGTYLWPARHRAGSGDARVVPPMGARFRLRASFSEAGFSARAQVILSAMKRHGMVVADNGSGWYFQGTSDTRWPDGLVSELKDIPASQFEAVDSSVLQVSPDSGAARR